MPKDTFFHLPEEKRAVIIRAAEDEFAANGFDLASIQKIIKKAGISRGSFYQYFHDKEDIFFLLLRRFIDAKIEYLQPSLRAQGDSGFFDFLKEVMKAAFKFASINPKGTKLAEEITRSRTMDWEKIKAVAFDELTLTMGQSPFNFYKGLVEKAIESGEINSSLSVERITFFIITLMEGTGKLLTDGSISEPYGKGGEELFDSLIGFLKHGLN